MSILSQILQTMPAQRNYFTQLFAILCSKLTHANLSIRCHAAKLIFPLLARQSYELLSTFVDALSRYDDHLVITGLNSFQLAQEEDPKHHAQPNNLTDLFEQCSNTFKGILTQIIEKDIASDVLNFVKFFSCLLQCGETSSTAFSSAFFPLYLTLFCPEPKLLNYSLNMQYYLSVVLCIVLERMPIVSEVHLLQLSKSIVSALNRCHEKMLGKLVELLSVMSLRNSNCCCILDSLFTKLYENVHKHMVDKCIGNLSCRSVFLLGIMSRVAQNPSTEANVSKALETASCLVANFSSHLSSSQIRSILLLLTEISTSRQDISLIPQFKDFFIQILSLHSTHDYSDEHCNLVLQCISKAAVGSIKSDVHSEAQVEVQKISIEGNMYFLTEFFIVAYHREYLRCIYSIYYGYAVRRTGS